MSCLLCVDARAPGAVDMVEDAIRQYMSCESGVQCAVLQTMTYTRFRWRWAAGRAMPEKVHLSADLQLAMCDGHVELWRKPPPKLVARAEPRKRRLAMED